MQKNNRISTHFPTPYFYGIFAYFYGKCKSTFAVNIEAKAITICLFKTIPKKCR